MFDCFKYFKAYVENHLHTSLKVLRTDERGEFTSTTFHQFYSNHGIIHQASCPHSPQQNGTAKRKHRHIVECSLTMLSHSSLPLPYWSYAVSTATHIINRLPTPLLNHKSPWEIMFQSKPDLLHLRSFGCTCFPLLYPTTNTRFNLIPNIAYFLVTLPIQRVTSILNLALIGFIFLDMSFSMKLSFSYPCQLQTLLLIQLYPSILVPFLIG